MGQKEQEQGRSRRSLKKNQEFRKTKKRRSSGWFAFSTIDGSSPNHAKLTEARLRSAYKRIRRRGRRRWQAVRTLVQSTSIRSLPDPPLGSGLWKFAKGFGCRDD